MNLAEWSSRKFIAIPEEDLLQNESAVFAYISANSDKVFLLPETTNFSLPEIDNVEDVHFAREMKFSCPATLITSSEKFIVQSLSEALEHVTCDENFLVVPSEISANIVEIRRQCFILQVPLEICSEEEYASIAVEKKLTDNSKALLGELDNSKNLIVKQSELKSAANTDLLERFFTAANNLESHLKIANAPTKILVIGEEAEREPLAKILRQLNFVVSIHENFNAPLKNVSDFAAILVASNVLNKFQESQFIKIATQLPDKNKIIFVAIRPALREIELTINPSLKLLEFAKILDATGLAETSIFFIDAPEIFPILQQNTELPTVNEITNELALTGRDKYLVQNSLEKFFNGSLSFSSMKLLQKTGVPFLEKHLRSNGKKSLSATNALIQQFGQAVEFLDGDSLKSIQLDQMKKILSAELQAEKLREKISLFVMQNKIVSGTLTGKAILYDLNIAINDFAQSLKQISGEIFDELVNSEEFSVENLNDLYNDKFPKELKNLIVDTEQRLKIEYNERFKILNGLAENILSKHRTQTEEFVNAVVATIKEFSNVSPPRFNFTKISISDVPPFDAGLNEIFSFNNLTALVRQCTKIFCIQEPVSKDWNFFRKERHKLLKRFYLMQTFRKKLRQNLEQTFLNRMNLFEKVLREKIFKAFLENFMQTSKICRSHCEFCSTTLRQQVDSICDEINAMDKDISVMQEVQSSLKKLHEVWQNICAAQKEYPSISDNTLDDLSREISDRKNYLSAQIKISFEDNDLKCLTAEKFLGNEKLDNRHQSANEDFSAGKKDFNKKQYETALEKFSRAATAGHVGAITYLAYMYKCGLGTNKNLDAAINNYLDSFYLGDDDAISELSEICQKNLCYSHALEWYQMAVDRGYDI